MVARRAYFAAWSLALALAGCRESAEPTEPTPVRPPSLNVQPEDDVNVLTIDHSVPHVSTLPADAGKLVHLFVRERVRADIEDGRPRKAVLIIQGVSVPVLPLVELRYRDYDWAL